MSDHKRAREEEEVKEAVPSYDVYTVVVSRDGKKALTACADRAIRLWRLEDMVCLGVFVTTRRSHVLGAFFLEDDESKILGVSTHAVDIWCIATATVERRVFFPKEIRVDFVVSECNGQQLFMCGLSARGKHHVAYIYDWDKRTFSYCQPGGNSVITKQFDWVFRYNGGDTVTMSAVSNRLAPVSDLFPALGQLSAMAVSPDGKHLALGGVDGIRMFNLGNGKITGFHSTLTIGRVSVLKYSRRGHMLGAGTSEGGIGVWYGATPVLSRPGTTDGIRVTCMDFSPADDAVVVGHSDGRVLSVCLMDNPISVSILGKSQGGRLSPITAAVMGTDRHFVAVGYASGIVMARNIYTGDSTTMGAADSVKLPRVCGLAFTDEDCKIVIRYQSGEEEVRDLLL